MNSSDYTNESNIDTVLGDDIRFKGVLKFQKSLKIKGKFNGSIEDSGVLVVGENAVINANIVAENVIISGRVTGNINAKKSLELQRHAKIKGDIKTPDIVINTGAIFNGKCEMETI